ncbi:hypothetical protein E1269_30450 [Jiangella asiatica]|uniref:Uncharacterized protein n=1 Tax=Jiangella asiatica TaxID=2530372 RepID=A0A4R5CAN3_9ACTN|nr:hypothetical protein E1269_30450 [Jiangella asiatica]
MRSRRSCSSGSTLATARRPGDTPSRTRIRPPAPPRTRRARAPSSPRCRSRRTLPWPSSGGAA